MAHHPSILGKTAFYMTSAGHHIHRPKGGSGQPARQARKALAFFTIPVGRSPNGKKKIKALPLHPVTQKRPFICDRCSRVTPSNQQATSTNKILVATIIYLQGASNAGLQLLMLIRYATASVKKVLQCID
jgi:hypothetical protein